jgi:hypothetical protein
LRILACVSLVPLVLAQNNGTCSVCVDGTEPSLSNDTILTQSSASDGDGDGDGLSCDSIVTSARSAENNTLSCDLLQLAAFQGDCCPTFFSDACTLCPGGGIEAFPVFPMKEVPAQVLLNGELVGDVNCNDLTRNETIQLEFVKEFDTSPGVCDDTLLRRSAGWCGCEGVDVECVLCDGDEVLEKRHLLTGTPCSQIAYEVALLSTDTCPDAPAKFGFDPSALCCPNVEAPNTCQLCSDRQQFIPDRTLMLETYGQVTCADVREAATMIATDSDCQALRQDIANMCCLILPEPTTQPVECDLTCPDGALPPDPFKKDPVTGNSCESLATKFTKLSADECPNADTILGFDAHAFCCPGVELPKECALCSQDDQSLLYPNRVLFAYLEHTCEAIQASLLYAVGDGCHAVLDESRALRNCQCRGEISVEPVPDPVPNEGNGDRGISGATSWGITLSVVWAAAAVALISGL